jgi:hypothetical protein
MTHISLRRTPVARPGRRSRGATGCVVLAAAALAASAPAAQATPHQTPVGPAPSASTGCGLAYGALGQGGTGGSDPIICVASGTITIGPSSTVNTVTGPTITNSPGYAGAVTVANGPAAVGV